ncbi:MAG: 7-carboxy-7-deazaguanine synthase QueE [Verrucomicrobiota bacterium]
MLHVTEIFYSIQGESTRAGLPCVFVRLAGCNLDCRYCDTPQAHAQGAPMSAEDIAAETLNHDTPLVEITGGEPLLQPETPRLADALVYANRTVLIETNGTIALPERRSFHAILDWKTPGSGHPDSFRRDNLVRLRAGDELKFVICDRTDFDWAVERLREIPGAIPVLFSPAATLPPPQLADWILAARINVRLQLQLHKILWPTPDRPR